MVLALEDGSAKNRSAYEWKSASVTVAGTTGDTIITGISGFTTLFATVKRAHYIQISATGTSYFRLNSATNDVITVTSTTPYTNEDCVVEKLYVTTNGAAVTVTVNLH